MISRSFYRFDEVVSRLGTDSETLRQAVATGKVPVFLSLHGEQATLTRGEVTPDDSDPYCEFQLFSREPLYEDGDPIEMYTLSGWFRVGQRHSRDAARQDKFGQRLAIAPSTTDVEFTPWGISFLLDTRERHFSDNAWFLAADIDLGGAKALTPTKWPWGDHDTELLRHLAAVAQELWSTYPEDKLAPTNERVENFLKARGLGSVMAEKMATILRADDLVSGPRPKK